jgi:PH domain
MRTQKKLIFRSLFRKKKKMERKKSEEVVDLDAFREALRESEAAAAAAGGGEPVITFNDENDQKDNNNDEEEEEEEQGVAVVEQSREEQLAEQVTTLQNQLALLQAETGKVLRKAKRRMQELYADREALVSAARAQAAEYVAGVEEEREQAQQTIATLEAKVQQLELEAKAKEVEREKEKEKSAVVAVPAVAAASSSPSSSSSESAADDDAVSSARQAYVGELCHRLSVLLDPLVLADVVFSSVAAKSFDSPTLSGWLIKQGTKRRNWKKRWHVLQDNFLLYYRSQQDLQPIGVVYLHNAVVESVPASESHRAYSVRITTGPRIFNFCTDSSDTERRWIDALKSAPLWWEAALARTEKRSTQRQ